MADKKKKNARKSSKKQAQTNWVQTPIFRLCFLICVIAACILAFGKFGIVGSFLFNVLGYFLGSFTYIVLVAVSAFCIWYIFTKGQRKILRRYTLATICFSLVILIYTGCSNIDVELPWQQVVDIFRSTFAILFQGEYYSCGLIGALLAALSMSLFDSLGTNIIMVLLLIVASILVFYDWIFLKEHQPVTIPKIKKKPKIEKEKEIYADEIENLIQDIEPESNFTMLDAADIIGSAKKEEKSDLFSITVDDTKPKKKKKEVKKEEPKKEKPKKEKVKPENKEMDEIHYVLPPLSVLDTVARSSKNNSNAVAAKKQGQKLIQILEEFNIKAQLIQIHIGPSVTKFEIKPELGVRVSRISGLQDDIKMALAATDIRIEAPIPGKNAVGIEVPNVDKMPVQMRDLMSSIPQDQQKKPLLFCLGKDLMGECIYGQLDRMPHLLIAGATGSGKSVCVNSIICSLLMRTNPEEVKMILIDPKKVEFTPYNDIPHLLAPVITDGDLANKALKVVVEMMDHRYDLFGLCGVRNISAYNAYLKKHPEEKLQPLPKIVVIIDELADLMLVAAKEVEQSIQRITQLARAAGIHLVVATQRPSVDVITGVIKSNIPSRIAFAVASSIDSRTILDQSGAERLLGYGDMLYLPNGETVPKRIQGVFIQDEEVNQICEWIKEQGKPKYDDAFIQLKDLQGQGGMVNQECADPLYDEVKRFVIGSQKASTSLIQRKFSVGYARAARLMDVLEENGIIGPAQGSKPREVLVQNTYEDLAE